MLKECKKCGLEKDFYGFVYYPHSEEYLTVCGDCGGPSESIALAKLEKKKAAKAKQKTLKKQYNERKKEDRLELRQKLIAERGNICLDCKVSFPACCYDFHHRDPKEKEFEFSKARNRSEIQIRTEIAKCDLLCANCHRIRHNI